MPSTLFIDNLPQNINNHDLRRFFSKQGQLVDAYVPFIQKRRVYGRFGFIEVHSRQQGDRLILETNGKILGSKAIKVQWAKYPKRSRRDISSWRDTRRCEQNVNRIRGSFQKRTLNRERWAPKNQAIINNSSEDLAQQNKAAKVVQVNIVNENLDWLERS